MGNKVRKGVVKLRYLEQFLKNVKRFSDKNCGKNKELEHVAKPSAVKTTLVRLVGCFVLWILFTYPAQADFRVCNSTQGLVGVSIGYPVPSGWVSEGWWHISAASCKTVVSGPLLSRFYYLYAEDVSGKGRWDGSIFMCGQTSKFRIEGLHDCFARGYQKFGFQEIDTENQSNWMVDLREPEIGRSLLSDPLGQLN